MMGNGIATPLLPLFAQTFDITVAQIGSIISAFAFARILINVPAGYFSERFGRRLLLVGGPLIMGIASLLTGVAGDIGQLVGYRFMTGIGSAMFTTGAMAYLADISLPENRGQIIGYYQISFLVGVSFGPMVGGLVADRWNYPTAFFLVGFLSLVSAIWAFFRIPETRGPGVTVSSGEVPHQTLEGGQTWQGVVLLLGNPNFLLISFLTIGYFFTRTGSQHGLVPLLGHNRLGLTPGQLGAIFTASAITNLAGLLVSNAITDRIGRKRVIIPSTLICIIGLVLYVFSGSWWVFLVATLVSDLGSGLSGPAPAAYVTDLTPRGLYGVSMGIYRTFGDLGFVLGPVLLGWIADLTGSLETAILANAFLLTSVIAIFAFMSKERPRLPSPEAEVSLP